jgi:hypothetical protein
MASKIYTVQSNNTAHLKCHFSLDNHDVYKYYIHCCQFMNSFFFCNEGILLYYKFIIRFFMGYIAIYKQL